MPHAVPGAVLRVLQAAGPIVSLSQAETMLHSRPCRLRPSLLQWPKPPSSMAADVSVGLLGEHQLGNAATAMTAAAVLQQTGFDNISQESMLQGISQAYMPGRFQVRSVIACLMLVLISTLSTSCNLMRDQSV